MSGAPDVTVVDWAVANGRVIVTQDRPLAGLATERIRTGQAVRVVVVDRQAASPGRIAGDLACWPERAATRTGMGRYSFPSARDDNRSGRKQESRCSQFLRGSASDR